MIKNNLLLARLGHPYHNVTKSTDCFSDVFCCLTPYYIDKKIGYKDGLPNPISTPDLGIYKEIDGVILWQVHPWIDKDLIDNYKKPIVAFPMYDNDCSLKKEFYSHNIEYITLCMELHNKLTKYNLSSSYYQWFPCPAENNKKKRICRNYNTAFFWYRGDIPISKIMYLSNMMGIKKVIMMYKPDPHHATDRLESIDSIKHCSDSIDVRLIEWQKSRDDLHKILQTCDFYFAPRKLEGIGLAFLEAMALGLIVIAPNNPTYNEYISSGVNGILYDDGTNILGCSNMRYESIEHHVLQYCRDGYDDWINNTSKNVLKKMRNAFGIS